MESPQQWSLLRCYIEKDSRMVDKITYRLRSNCLIPRKRNTVGKPVARVNRNWRAHSSHFDYINALYRLLQYRSIELNTQSRQSKADPPDRNIQGINDLSCLWDRKDGCPPRQSWSDESFYTVKYLTFCIGPAESVITHGLTYKYHRHGSR